MEDLNAIWAVDYRVCLVRNLASKFLTVRHLTLIAYCYLTKQLFLGAEPKRPKITFLSISQRYLSCDSTNIYTRKRAFSMQQLSSRLYHWTRLKECSRPPGAAVKQGKGSKKGCFFFPSFSEHEDPGCPAAPTINTTNPKTHTTCW